MEITEYFKSLPPFTFWYIMGTLAMALLSTLKLINPYLCVVQPPESILDVIIFNNKNFGEEITNNSITKYSQV